MTLENEKVCQGTKDSGYLCAQARAAADSAVKKTFAILGVDIDHPEQVESFRASLRFGDRLRKIADRSFALFILTIVMAYLGASWLGVIESIRQKLKP